MSYFVIEIAANTYIHTFDKPLRFGNTFDCFEYRIEQILEEEYYYCVDDGSV